MLRKEKIDLIKSGKISIKKPEEKSFGVYGQGVPEQQLSSTAAAQYLIQPWSSSGRFGWRDLAAAAAFQYYKEISVIRNAIDLGADSFVTVPFCIKDHKTGELITEFDPRIPATSIINLLKTPNQDKSEAEFKTSHYTAYQATGETFFLTTSLEQGSDPLEIYYIDPQNVSNPSTNVDEVTLYYQIGTGRFVGQYIRKELPDGKIIYINGDGTKQLWVKKTFNPDRGNTGRGLSKLSSIFYEIEQHSGVSKHNNGILRNGVRPSGAVIPDKPEGHVGASLTDEQIQSIKQSVQSFYGGGDNAGNVMVLDGIKEFKELSMNSKDMEFMELLRMMKEQIYNNLNIPLPMVTGKIMTFANFEESKFMLFDMNIIPFSTCYAEELDRFLMPRFDDSGRYEYVVNLDKIPALEIRKMKKIEMFKDVLTKNEQRELVGFEERTDGDVFAEPSKAKVASPDEKSKEEFIDAMRDKGTPEDEIQKKADLIYGSCHTHK